MNAYNSRVCEYMLPAYYLMQRTRLTYGLNAAASGCMLPVEPIAFLGYNRGCSHEIGSERMPLRRVEVVAAVIVRDEEVLATQRGYGEFEGWWEFPGGKVDAGETPEQALVREIREELNAAVLVGEHLCTAEHDYPTFHLSMRCYVCKLADEGFELREHHAARWLDAVHLHDVDWLPADVQVVEAIVESGLVK